MDSYLQVQQGNGVIILPGSSPYVILGNISQAGTPEANDLENHIIVSLVNVEEDRISRPVNNYAMANQQVVYKNPPVFLNLEVLFTPYYTDYTSSLLQLSNIVKFFQNKNLFTTLNAPELPAAVDELIFDLKTLSLQDLNNLWGILGSKYIPSVIYKVRLVKITQDLQQGNVPLINEIIINDPNLIN